MLAQREGYHGLMPVKETGCWLNSSPRHFFTAVRRRTNKKPSRRIAERDSSRRLSLLLRFQAIKKADVKNPNQEFITSAYSVSRPPVFLGLRSNSSSETYREVQESFSDSLLLDCWPFNAGDEDCKARFSFFVLIRLSS